MKSNTVSRETISPPLAVDRSHRPEGAVVIKGHGGDVILGEEVLILQLPFPVQVRVALVHVELRSPVRSLDPQGKLAVLGDGPRQDGPLLRPLDGDPRAGEGHVAGAAVVVQQKPAARLAQHRVVQAVAQGQLLGAAGAEQIQGGVAQGQGALRCTR